MFMLRLKSNDYHISLQCIESPEFNNQQRERKTEDIEVRGKERETTGGGRPESKKERKK